MLSFPAKAVPQSRKEALFYYEYYLLFISIDTMLLIIFTAKNTVISPNFLVQKFCREAQFPHSFWRIAQNYAETVSFHKISTPGNQVKLRYFSQCFRMDSLKTGKLSSATDRLVNSSRVTPADTKNLLISVYEYEGKLTMSII